MRRWVDMKKMVQIKVSITLKKNQYKVLDALKLGQIIRLIFLQTKGLLTHYAWLRQIALMFQKRIVGAVRGRA